MKRIRMTAWSAVTASLLLIGGIPSTSYAMDMFAPVGEARAPQKGQPTKNGFMNAKGTIFYDRKGNPYHKSGNTFYDHSGNENHLTRSADGQFYNRAGKVFGIIPPPDPNLIDTTSIQLPPKKSVQNLGYGHKLNSQGIITNATNGIIGYMGPKGGFVDSVGKPLPLEHQKQILSLFTMPPTAAVGAGKGPKGIAYDVNQGKLSLEKKTWPSP